MADTISPASARRIALAAQGFGSRPTSVGTRQLNLLLHRLNLLQLDSVNVFERSHYLPVFARLGAYDKTLLDRLTMRPRAPYLEFWAHQAALIPVEDWPLFDWRSQYYRSLYSAEREPWVAQNGALLDWLRAELAAKGPMAVSEVEHESNKRKGGWWGWSDAKRGMEYLFFWGELTTAGRTRFERRYALTETIVPAELRERVVPKADAIRELVGKSAAALGIATLSDLADYYRLRVDETTRAVRELVDAGTLRPVTVPGWGAQAFLHADARIPRRIEATALLSPFDPIVWERSRALRMFGFHYRIEIYTPAPKRIFGYYTLPVLVDEALVGRVDLKNDRQRRVLRVQSAWREEGAPAETADRVAVAVREAAAWQGLGEIEVVERGDLARELAAALGATLVEAVEPPEQPGAERAESAAD